MMQVSTIEPDFYAFSWTEHCGEECEVRFESLDIWTRFVLWHMARDYSWAAA